MTTLTVAPFIYEHIYVYDVHGGRVSIGIERARVYEMYAIIYQIFTECSAILL